MWQKTFSKIYPGLKKEEVLSVWADVANWPKWDVELEYCKMKDPFSEGSAFILKPKSGPKVKIVLTEVVHNQGFTNYCKFPGATMVVAHTLEEAPEGLRITHIITVKGFLGFFWVKLVAKNVAAAVPETTENLVNFVRSKKL